MSNIDVDDLTNDLYEQFGGDESGIDKSAVREKIENLLEYNVPESEVRRSVESEFGSRSNGGAPDGDGDTETELIPVNEVNTDGDFIDVEVAVIRELDASHDALSQKVVVGDESGTTVVTAFSGDGHDDLEVGESYLLEGVQTDEYQGDYSINLTQYSDITHLEDTDIDVDTGDRNVVAPVVEVNDTSGLIKRCGVEDCTRVLDDGRCSEHGDVEGENDLRVKAGIDVDGEKFTVFLDEDQTSDLIDKSLEDAIEKFKETMDSSIIRTEVKDEFLGKYFRFEGTVNEDRGHFYVDDFERFESDVSEQADELLTRALGA